MNSKKLAFIWFRPGLGRMNDYELPEADHSISALQVQAGYVKRGLPIVIRTLASCWPISQACNLASLRTIHGELEVPSGCKPDRTTGVPKKPENSTQTSPTLGLYVQVSVKVCDGSCKMMQLQDFIAQFEVGSMYIPHYLYVKRFAIEVDPLHGRIFLNVAALAHLSKTVTIFYLHV